MLKYPHERVCVAAALETHSLNKSSIKCVEFSGEPHFHSDSLLSSSMFFCSSSFTLKCVLLYLDFICKPLQTHRPDKDPLKSGLQFCGLSPCLLVLRPCILSLSIDKNDCFAPSNFLFDRKYMGNTGKLCM